MGSFLGKHINKTFDYVQSICTASLFYASTQQLIDKAKARVHAKLYMEYIRFSVTT